MENDNVLCTEFKVACEICYWNSIGDVVSREDVVDRIGYIVHRDDTNDAVRFLINWGIVRVDVSQDVLSLFISPNACSMISDLCMRYWMPVILERGDKDV